VDQVQIDPVQAQPFEGPLEGSPGVGLTGVLDPELGRHEDCVPGDAAAADRAPDRLLVLIRGSGVDEPIPDLERNSDGRLGVLRWDLKDAETEDRHLDTVVQGDVRDSRLHSFEASTPQHDRGVLVGFPLRRIDPASRVHRAAVSGRVHT
jgi:hypothetical protein